MATGLNSVKLSRAAGAIWTDDAVGALVDHLTLKGVYDNTFLVIMNDHGMGAKATLYEQGSSIIQIIRYPELFPLDNAPYEIPADFIVGNMDGATD